VNDVLTANKAIARTDLDVTYFCSVRKDSGFITQMNELVASGQGVDWRATVLRIFFACENQTRSSSTVGALVIGGKSSS
jgi:hypothetical protein